MRHTVARNSPLAIARFGSNALGQHGIYASGFTLAPRFARGNSPSANFVYAETVRQNRALKRKIEGNYYG